MRRDAGRALPEAAGWSEIGGDTAGGGWGGRADLRGKHALGEEKQAPSAPRRALKQMKGGDWSSLASASARERCFSVKQRHELSWSDLVKGSEGQLYSYTGAALPSSRSRRALLLQNLA